MINFTQGQKMNIDNIIPSTLKVIASSGIDLSQDYKASEKTIAHLIENAYEKKDQKSTSCK